ncbi:MAG: uroporphyrinogen-III synthase [Streptosporangiales bacterium]|nr:uroporphyrinogen-III synthase [Streptosporangiales bacterium]
MTVQATEPGPEPLAGFSVAVTAARRADELCTMLERRGATVLHAAAIRIVPLADDTELLAASRDVIAHPPSVVVATTGIGFRGWIEAVEAWGLTDPLLDVLRGAAVLARGPKAKGAVRAAGITEAWSPPSESSAEVLDHLLAEGVAGKRVAVQLHGEPLPDFCAALRLAGAEVVTVPVYRWVTPADTGPLDRLVDAIVRRGLDAVTFTSAPAAASLLAHAHGLGLGWEVCAALRHDVLAMCVGPVTAGPLEKREIPTVWPARARLGALVRRLAEELPARARVLPVAGYTIELRRRAVIVDGTVRPLAPAAVALLRELARRPGEVVSRSRLLAALPGGGDDEHAVEMAVARLRSALGTPRLVQTVVKRGYRLALEPGSCDGPERPG